MSSISPTLRLALAGACLTVAPRAEAAQTGASVFAGLRLSGSKGTGFGLGAVVKPALVVAPEAAAGGLHLGMPVVWTHTFGEHRGNAVDLMGQVGGAFVRAPYCRSTGMTWYIPALGLSSQGGVRRTNGEWHGLAGVALLGPAAVELDYTADLTDAAHNRTSLSLGYPVPVSSCRQVALVVDGRPLRDESGVTAPAFVEVVGGGEVCAEAADWLKRASDELGAVRSFVELADHLRAHGAPSSLVNRASRAAEEELEHAALCMGMASQLLGRPVRGAVPATTGRSVPELAVLAAESHVDGWHNEGQASEAAAARAAATDDPLRRWVEMRIAEEETAHAHLGRALDAWASWKGGRQLRRQRGAVVEALLHEGAQPESSHAVGLAPSPGAGDPSGPCRPALL